MSILPLSLLALFRAIERGDRASIQAVFNRSDPLVQVAAARAADDLSGAHRAHRGTEIQGKATVNKKLV